MPKYCQCLCWFAGTSLTLCKKNGLSKMVYFRRNISLKKYKFCRVVSAKTLRATFTNTWMANFNAFDAFNAESLVCFDGLYCMLFLIMTYISLEAGLHLKVLILTITSIEMDKEYWETVRNTTCCLRRESSHCLGLLATPPPPTNRFLC